MSSYWETSSGLSRARLPLRPVKRRRIQRLGIAMLLLASIVLWTQAATARAVDWPSFRGGPEQNPVRTDSPGLLPSLLWTGPASVRGEPCVIVAGDAPITVASPAADFGAQRLLKVNPADGSVTWQTASPPAELREGMIGLAL